MKTKFNSFCSSEICEGCKYCVRGEKLVLFVSGKCSRSCWYCSLSEKRKNKDIIYANEREIKNEKELVEEVKESQATSAGITGGDALLFLDRTIKLARDLKKNFENFHIHIYLPTKLADRYKLRKLSNYIDEIRFHPEFLTRKMNEEEIKKDIEKIKLAGEFWSKDNIGIELPCIPDKKTEILEFIKKVKSDIGFANLNEFEISDSNFDIIKKKYKMNEDTYTIKNSVKAGKWIIKKLEKEKIKIHLCTADTKNNYQYQNRLRRHLILPYGKRTEDGNVVYLVTKEKVKGAYYDRRKKRYILPEEIARKLLGKIKITRVEEFPTYDRIEIEEEEIS